MQSEAETGKMSHGIKYPINLNAHRWSNTTQPRCFKEDFTDASQLSPSLGLRINPPRRSLPLLRKDDTKELKKHEYDMKASPVPPPVNTVSSDSTAGVTSAVSTI
ncbi:hypothetical protein EYF80_030865 [Liparis tanakae]|uniref:Uncharacterized protein n=1 Tax=Liparis tanakae TaxID=230148 RepID=A0A4Z2H249_9TELE|nr:hypothetical protein EYF80_030865 [Liparis tanakae]